MLKPWDSSYLVFKVPVLLVMFTFWSLGWSTREVYLHGEWYHVIAFVGVPYNLSINQGWIFVILDLYMTGQCLVNIFINSQYIHVYSFQVYHPWMIWGLMCLFEYEGWTVLNFGDLNATPVRHPRHPATSQMAHRGSLQLCIGQGLVWRI